MACGSLLQHVVEQQHEAVVQLGLQPGRRRRQASGELLQQVERSGNEKGLCASPDLTSLKRPFICGACTPATNQPSPPLLGAG